MKKFYSFILALIFVFQLSSNAFASSSNQEFYEQARGHFESEGILKEGTEKRDMQKINKAVFFKIAMENAGFSPNAKILLTPTPFKDVDPKSWYAPYVQKAYRLGVINKEENFHPNQHIRRIEAFKLLLELEGYNVPKFYENKISYKDLRSSEEKQIAAKILDMSVYTPRSESIFGAQPYIRKKEAIEMIYRFYLISEGNNAAFTEPKVHITVGKPSDLKNIELLESVKEQLFSKYYKSENLDEEKMMDEAIQGFVKGVDDKYTVYFPPQESKSFVESIDGSFEGIGAYLEETDNGVVIQTPIKDSPAEISGVLSGDIIRKVDKVDVADMPIREVVHLIKGPAGTNVEIEFERKRKPVTIIITRARIEIPSIQAEVKDNILVITLAQFGTQTSQKFSDIITEHYKPSLRGVIIDVRSNPGGLLSTVEDLLSYWVGTEGNTIQLKYKRFTQEKKPRENQLLANVKTAILQNKASASASEILAGTLKDYEKATIFGETSFGKGSVQEVVAYRNGSSLKLTIAEWLTGAGTPINGIGVIPNVEVEDKKETKEDEVMNAAVMWMKR